MSEILDHKYTINAAKTETRELIPQDECILFRATDKLLVPLLEEYKVMADFEGCPDIFIGELVNLIDRVKIWQSKNLSRVHLPD